jgi:hypothetical protein
MVRRNTVLVCAALAALAGCMGTGPALPHAVPAKGVIQLADGGPMREGRLELSPKDKGGVEAFGDVQPDGSFTLTSYKANDGAVPGTYVVTISPYNYAARGGSPTPIADAGRISPKYLDAATSNLVVEIKPTDNVLHLQLDAR